MANNIIKRIWNQNTLVNIEALRGAFFQDEDGGHTFEISGVDNSGNAISLSGTVAGVFLRPDNTDVPINGSASGGIVSVTLPAECYDVPGRFGLTVFVTSDGQKTCVYAAIGTVGRTSSGSVAPGTSADVVDLINQISAAVATIPASWSGLMADIAPTYSTSAAYPVGAYVYYNGDLYRCTTAITTGETWTAAHWTTAVLGNDVSDLKTAFDGLFFHTTDVTGQLANGYYVTNQDTGATVPTTRNSSNTDKCGIFPCKKGDVFTITGKGGQSNRTWAFTDSDYKMLSKSAGSAQVSELSLTAQQNGYFFFNSETSKNPEVKYTSYMYVTDKTLSENDVPADAKSTGDALKSIGKITITDPKRIPWHFGEMSASGTITYNLNGVVTLYHVRVYAGSVIGTKNSTIKFNAQFTFDDGTTYYKAWNSNGYTVNKNGRVLISVGLSSGASIHNISLLDNLNISLICDNDLISKFLRTDVMLGHIPANDYVGRHADTSGFSQTTDYATAIQPWRDFATNNSGYITERDFGAIYENGPHQYWYTLNPPNRSVSEKKLARVFVVTSQHGHEKSATYGMSYLIKDMLEHSLEDPVLFYLRNFVRFIVLPIANPYGWNANSSLGTHGGIRQNENGVNLNRNFGVSTWANYNDDPDYTTPGEYNYRGTAPFSEIETQNIRSAIVASHSDISLMIDIHTYGTDTTSAISITFVGANKDSDSVMKKIYESFDQYLCGVKNHMDALYDVNIGLSQVYGSSTLDTVVNMTMQDYGYDAVQVPSVTLEVPCGATNGFLGNKLSKYSADLIKLCGEMIGNFIAKALYYIHEQ